jgi:hypothetical protein
MSRRGRATADEACQCCRPAIAGNSVDDLASGSNSYARRNDAPAHDRLFFHDRAAEQDAVVNDRPFLDDYLRLNDAVSGDPRRWRDVGLG